MSEDGGSSTVHGDLAWETEGQWLKSLYGRNMECGLLVGEVPEMLLGTIEVPSSKAPNPQLLGRLSINSPPCSDIYPLVFV